MHKTVPTNRDERYRVVTTYDYAHPLTIASVPMDRDHALSLFAALLMSGSYSPDSGRRTRVLSVAECERWGIR